MINLGNVYDTFTCWGKDNGDWSRWVGVGYRKPKFMVYGAGIVILYAARGILSNKKTWGNCLREILCNQKSGGNGLGELIKNLKIYGKPVRGNYNKKIPLNNF